MLFAHHGAALDPVYPPLVGLRKVVSEDAVRRALAKIDETTGMDWLQTHLDYCVSPLLQEPWVLDAGTTCSIHPEIPLHTNGSKNDIRCQVTKRQVSGGTESNIGRDCCDAFLGLAKTCRKLGTLLGLPWRQARCLRRTDRPAPSRTHPLPKPARLT